MAALPASKEDEDGDDSQVAALPPVPSLESILQVGCVASSVDE